MSEAINSDRCVPMSLLLDLAEEASAYVQAKDDARKRKQQYRECREHFFRQHDMQRKPWAERLEDRAFQLATGKPHREYQRARQQQKNAERRMERRYRKLIREGVVS